MDCILDITACLRAVTLASGNFSAICSTNSVIGQSRQKAAISTMETLPSLPSTFWKACRSPIMIPSSVAPVGLSMDVTVNSFSPRTSESPTARLKVAAVCEPMSSSSAWAGGVPSHCHQFFRASSDSKSTPMRRTSLPLTEAAPSTFGATKPIFFEYSMVLISGILASSSSTVL